MRAAALVLVLAALPATVAQKEFPPDPSASACAVRYVEPESKGKKRESYSGSGTVVACEPAGAGKEPWSLVLTCGHVCPKADAWAEVALGWRRYDAWVSYREEGPGKDLAVLLVRSPLPAARIAAAFPGPGEPVSQWGYGGFLPVRKTGVAKADTDRIVLPGPMYDHGTTIQAEPGDSGSGLFDAKGRLVGVTWSSGGHAVRLADVRRVVGHVAADVGMAETAKELGGEK